MIWTLLHYLTWSYIVTGVFWGGYAVKRQREEYPNNSSLPALFLVYCLNFSFWPIAMVIASRRSKKNEHS